VEQADRTTAEFTVAAGTAHRAMALPPADDQAEDLAGDVPVTCRTRSWPDPFGGGDA